ncbi:DNA-binding transcriptional regulator, MarR family [Nakamurella panacisegetis]|uniref:DNA-binding transcriptional regulator, MarR family n=1 Tax=Nakamurella panacisegetis TaxID=1090615 RepID=A0A1H0IVU5_9ACTN|nr:MarR family winged helix-turn-helix transcriptional regulator [Nakamurella panacisegetis]SDO35628.1 DNA-binding transcriptional regulator, MarR family [Nakamurella panacisegetis]
MECTSEVIGWSVVTYPDLSGLFRQLVRFQIELWDGLDVRLRSEHDLPLARFEILQAIDARGTCRVFDIAEDLVVTMSGISKLVDRVEAAGYCRRRANPDDRRSSLIELTDDGRTVMEQANATYQQELDKRFDAVLSEAELRQLHGTLDKLRAAGHTIKRKPS